MGELFLTIFIQALQSRHPFPSVSTDRDRNLGHLLSSNPSYVCTGIYVCVLGQEEKVSALWGLLGTARYAVYCVFGFKTIGDVLRVFPCNDTL